MEYGKLPIFKWGAVHSYALVDLELLDDLKEFRWTSDNRNYVRRQCHKTQRHIYKSGVIWLHRYVTDAPDGILVDHINGDRLDNRRSNLRFATVRQNTVNRHSVGKFGYRGVFSNKRAATFPKPFFSQIRGLDGKLIYLGSFETPEECARAFDKAALEIHGEFARLNFPLDKAD